MIQIILLFLILLLSMKDGVKIMGVLNATPDSFYEPSRYNMSILDAGVDIIDIGACSTRPGAEPVSEEEEWRRLRPVLEEVLMRRTHPVISIDTFRSEIAFRAAQLAGRIIVNDISAGAADPQMLPFVRSNGFEYVAMHGGNSLSGSDIPLSGLSVVDAVHSFFETFAVAAEGIDWILDPGFGFGKSYEQNWDLLENLGEFTDFGRRILVGVSRKKMTKGTKEETLRAHKIAVERGADILRVHEFPIL